MKQITEPVLGTMALFWRDLSVLIAAVVLIATVGSFIVVVPVSLLAKLVLPARQAELVAYPMGYALVALGLGYWWWKHGLSPRHRAPAREGRFRWGHVLLLVLNVMLLTIFLPPLFGFSLMPRVPAAAGLIISFSGLLPVGLIAGLYMVWSARESAPAFADTVPATPTESPKTQFAPWPPALPAEKLSPIPSAASRVRSTIIVVFGLFVSSLLLFMAAVYGALSFQSNAQLFTGTVIPVLGFGYVVYLTTALFLLIKGRRFAIWAAWTPTIFFTIALPALQVIQLMFRGLISR